MDDNNFFFPADNKMARAALPALSSAPKRSEAGEYLGQLKTRFAFRLQVSEPAKVSFCLRCRRQRKAKIELSFGAQTRGSLSSRGPSIVH